MAQEYTVKWFGQQVFDAATSVSIDAMNKAAFIVERDVKKSFGTGASRVGVKSRRGRNRFHRPSAPGSPPAVDYGALRASIANEVIQSGREIVGFVGVDDNKLKEEVIKRRKGRTIGIGVRGAVKYGLYLELGTRNMQPRPFLRPALRRNERKIMEIFRKAIG